MTNTSTPPVSAGELALIQADINSLMEQTITMQRRTTGQGPTGNITTSYTNHGTVVGTLTQPTPQQLQNYDYLVAAKSAWQVRLPIGTNIQATDRLVIGSLTMEVQVVLQPKSYQAAILLLATAVR